MRRARVAQGVLQVGRRLHGWAPTSPAQKRQQRVALREGVVISEVQQLPAIAALEQQVADQLAAARAPRARATQQQPHRARKVPGMAQGDLANVAGSAR